MENFFSAKEVAEHFDLPYGRNILYKKLREFEFLDDKNYPSKEMETRNLIVVKQKNIFGLGSVYVPLFTWEFISFIEKYLVEIEAD
jgi:hypothetical protein